MDMDLIMSICIIVVALTYTVKSIVAIKYTIEDGRIVKKMMKYLKKYAKTFEKQLENMED